MWRLPCLWLAACEEGYQDDPDIQKINLKQGGADAWKVVKIMVLFGLHHEATNNSLEFFRVHSQKGTTIFTTFHMDASSFTAHS